MLGNYNDTRSSSFMQGLKDVLGHDLGVDELASVDLFEEDVRILDQLDHFTSQREGSRTLVMRDVYLDSSITDQSPDRSGALFSWDHSPDRGPNTPKRMKKNKNGGLGSSCSSPAMSDASDDGLSLLGYDSFSVASSPLSGTLMDDIRALTGPGDELLDSFCWMGDDDPIFTTLITPPTPADGSLPWERNTTDRRKRDSKQDSYLSCSSNSMWNSAKKWSQLRYDEKREALSGLIDMIENLGVRERLDLNQILNISQFCANPIIDLNSLNDDKWKRVKTYMKKLMKTGNDTVSESSSQLRTWQSSDHIYAPLKRPAPTQPCPSSRVLPPPGSSQAQSRLSAGSHHTTSPVSSSASASRDSSSNRRPTTLNLLLNQSKTRSVPSKKDFPTDKRNIIKARRKGVNRKYKPSKNSILKKDVIQKITENANRVTKKGLRMQVDEKDVEKALSGCFEHEEKVELSYNDVDEYIDVQA